LLGLLSGLTFVVGLCAQGGAAGVEMRFLGATCAAFVLALGCGTNRAGGGSGETAAPDGGSGGGSGPVQHALHIRVTGSGEIRSTNPAISCRTDCQQNLDASVTVHLEAIPDPGFKLDGWQGDCSGAAACDLTVSADRTAAAVFSAIPPPPPGSARISVVLMGSGGGRIVSTPAGIDCPGSCGMTVVAGSGVTLSAQPDASSTFSGWGGGCSGPGACGLNPAADVTVWANFTANAPPPPPPPPPAPTQCASLPAPDPVVMQQYVAQPSAAVHCGGATGDAFGTLALTMDYMDPSNHGSLIEFVSAPRATFLREQYSSSETLRPMQQPNGLASAGDAGHLYPYGPSVRLGRWDTGGNWLGDSVWRAENFAPAADPNGGVLVAGDLSSSVSGPLVHQAVMFTGGGAAYGIKWGPQPLASAGAVYGAGVDLTGRSLIVTDGAARFGAGAISAQWFERDGTALTGEFELITGFTAGQSTWFETWPLIGGGLVVVRMDSDASFHSRAIGWVQGGRAVVLPPQPWMSAHPDTRLQPSRGGQGYLVLPLGAPNTACTQTLEVLAQDGTSCASRDYPIAAGTCDTSDLLAGQDGTVIQQLPASMEAMTDPSRAWHTCTWRYWPMAAH
jgi:List-Bact-rpt repeat protein